MFLIRRRLSSPIAFVLTLVLCLFPPLAGAQGQSVPVKEMKAVESFGSLKPNPQLNSLRWFQLDQSARKALDSGNFAEAERLWKEALQVSEKETRYEPGVVNCLIGLSLLYHKKGDDGEATRLYELAMRTMEGLFGRQSVNFAKYMPDLALLYHDQGKKDKAEVLFKHHLELHEATHGADAPEIVDSLNHYSKFLKKTGRLPEASRMDARVKGILDKSK